MVQYGSFDAERAGPVAPEETWAEMKDTSKSKGSMLATLAYGLVGVVALGVIIYACVALSGTGAATSSSAEPAAQQQLAEPVSTSESSVKTGKMRDAHRRLHLKTLMTTPAIHWAQNYLIEQVAKWARTHPTEPGHNGMTLILQKEPEKYKPVVEALVKKKLASLKDCDVHNVCSENPVAEGIRNKVCPGGAPCSQQVLAQIDKTADWAAKIATDGAFHGLLQQMEHPAPVPLQHFGPGSHEPPKPATGPPPAGGAWQSPGANTGW
mmetsp:Transcript_49972/g.99726  ORF Transcript_49972/g.99726 Transcript_49972/m.99726 type:complete len:266 (-) Transcript_49972:127-924(-)